MGYSFVGLGTGCYYFYFDTVYAKNAEAMTSYLFDGSSDMIPL